MPKRNIPTYAVGRLVYNVDFNTHTIQFDDGTWHELFPGDAFEVKDHHRWVPVRIMRAVNHEWFLVGKVNVKLSGARVRFTKI